MLVSGPPMFDHIHAQSRGPFHTMYVDNLLVEGVDAVARCVDAMARWGDRLARILIEPVSLSEVHF